jgi:hypothetical protein
LSVYNTNFYCRLALGDGMVDHGSYARQWRSSSTSSSSRSHQSRDEQNDEWLQCHEELMQNLMQAAYRSRLLASSPTAISRSAFRYSSPIDGSGVLAVADTMGISTRRAGAIALWIVSVEDTAASTYDFHATHCKTSFCKNRFHMFT